MTHCDTVTLCDLQMTCMLFRMMFVLLTMTLCEFYNDMTSCTLSDFCALIMMLYAHTRTLCGLIMTLSFPVNDVVIPSNEPCHRNSSCHAHAFCMTLTVTVWDAQWVIVMLTMILCALTMTMCAQTGNEYVCPYNDSVIHKIALCSFSKTVLSSQWLCSPLQWQYVIFTMTVCDFHNESLWLHNDLHAFKMRLCTLTMTLCDLYHYHTLTIKFDCDCDFDNDFVWLHSDSVWPHSDIAWPHNEFICPKNGYVWLSQWLCNYHISIWPWQWLWASQWLRIFTRTLGVLTMTVWPLQWLYDLYNNSLWP